MKTLLYAIGGFLAALLLVSLGLFAWNGFSASSVRGWMHGGLWPLHMFGMGLFWVLVIAGVVYLIKDNVAINQISSPKRTLDERLARGEIDKETYNDLRRTLEDNRQ